MADNSKLIEQLRAELQDAQKSLAFWQTQPSALAVGATASMLEIRERRIRGLENAIAAIEGGLAVLKADDGNKS